MKNRTNRGGFSLLELIVAVSIMVILVGAAVPVTSKVLTYKARLATKQEVELLSDAAADYFEDTRQLPGDRERGNLPRRLDAVHAARR